MKKPLVYVAHPYGGKESNKKKIDAIMSDLVLNDTNFTYVSPIHNYGFVYLTGDEYQKGLDICLGLLEHCKVLVLCDGRRLVIDPEFKADFREMPFKNETFSLVVFDPPHLIRAGENSWIKKKYGSLNSQAWKDDIKQGLSECYRVLKVNGTMIFKWNEEQVSFADVKPLLPATPIVGQRRGKTIFLVIFKGDAQ